MESVITRPMTLAERERMGMPAIEWIDPVSPRQTAALGPAVRMATTAKAAYVYLSRPLWAALQARGTRTLRFGYDPQTQALVLQPDGPLGFRVTPTGRVGAARLRHWWQAHGWPVNQWWPAEADPDGVWWCRPPKGGPAHDAAHPRPAAD